MATDKKSQSGNSAWGGDSGDGQYLAIGISLGLSIGVALSLVLDSWAFLGAGLAIGVALGVSLDAAKKDKADPEADGPEGSGRTDDGMPGGPTKPRIDE